MNVLDMSNYYTGRADVNRPINTINLKEHGILIWQDPHSDLASRVTKLEEMLAKQDLKLKKLKIKNKELNRKVEHKTEELRLMIQYVPGSQCYHDAKDEFYRLAGGNSVEYDAERL